MLVVLQQSGRLEHFKKKKKGKKTKSVQIDPNEKQTIDFSIDFDEIIDKVEEAREEETELPEDDNEPDEEDEEGYNSPPGEGGPDDDTANDPEVTLMQYRQEITQQVLQEQQQTIAQQPDYFIEDLLYFTLAEQMITKRLICVVPERYKELYMFTINDAQPVGSALLIGARDPVVILKETRPSALGKINLLIDDNYEQVKDYGFVIFYDEPKNHPFLKWLNASKLNVKPFDYLHVYNDGIPTLLSMYPFFRIETVDMNIHLPNIVMKTKNISTLKVNLAVYSNKKFKDEFYDIYDKYAQESSLQTFYELFFDYYPEILKNKVKISSSIKLKNMVPKVERFSNSVQHIEVNIDQKLQTLRVTSTIGQYFKEMQVDKDELIDILSISPKVFDKLQIRNQVHDSLNGVFYIVGIKNNTVLLQSRFLLKHVGKITIIDKHFVTTSQLDRYIKRHVRKYDEIFLKSIKAPGVYLGFDSEKQQYKFQVTFSNTDDKYICFTNSKLATKTACTSEYDEFGKQKKDTDVWDKPCEFHEECPFFGADKFDKFRGGCLQGGYCEMPLGVKNVSYRTYAVSSNDFINAIRFNNDIFSNTK
jgi:hypothetical protein